MVGVGLTSQTFQTQEFSIRLIFDVAFQIDLIFTSKANPSSDLCKNITTIRTNIKKEKALSSSQHQTTLLPKMKPTSSVRLILLLVVSSTFLVNQGMAYCTLCATARDLPKRWAYQFEDGRRCADIYAGLSEISSMDPQWYAKRDAEGK